MMDYLKAMHTRDMLEVWFPDGKTFTKREYMEKHEEDENTYSFDAVVKYLMVKIKDVEEFDLNQTYYMVISQHGNEMDWSYGNWEDINERLPNAKKRIRHEETIKAKRYHYVVNHDGAYERFINRSVASDLDNVRDAVDGYSEKLASATQRLAYLENVRKEL